jgi:dynein heavy chain, axonemal
VSSWVEGFFDVGKIIARVDMNERDYIADLKSDPTIIKLMDNFIGHLRKNQELCNEYRNMYMQFEHLWTKDRSLEFRDFLISERFVNCIEKLYTWNNRFVMNRVVAETIQGNTENGGVDGAAIEESQNDSESTNAKPSGLPPLAAFEAKILQYKSIQARIEEMKPSIEIGWLRINAQPIKQALSTWASKWIHTYTSFLQNQIARQLAGLDSFMRQV